MGFNHDFASIQSLTEHVVGVDLTRILSDDRIQISKLSVYDEGGNLWYEETPDYGIS